VLLHYAKTLRTVKVGPIKKSNRATFGLSRCTYRMKWTVQKAGVKEQERRTRRVGEKGVGGLLRGKRGCSTGKKAAAVQE